MFKLTNFNTFESVTSIVQIMEGLPHHHKWQIRVYADAYDEVEFVLRPQIAKGFTAVYICDPCLETFLKNMLIQRPNALISMEPTTKIACASSAIMRKYGMNEE
jgi:hypothetical protein